MSTPRLLAAVVVALATLAGASALAQADVSASPSPLAFGNAHVGDVEVDTITLTADTAGTVLAAINTTGDCADYTFTAALPHTFVAGGDTFEVGVDFEPTARGAQVCKLFFVDDNGGALGDTNVEGTGTAPVMVVTSSLAFPATRVAGGTAVLQLAIQNTSNDVGEVLHTTLALGGAAAGDYALAETTVTVDPLDTVLVDVTFDPSATGNRVATVTVDGDDPANPSDSTSLTGTGTSAVIDVTPASTSFGSVVTGTTGTRTVTIHNLGVGASLTIDDGALAGGSWFVFGTTPQAGCAGAAACDFTPDLSLSAGGTRAIQVRCVPPFGQTGTQTATISFGSDADPGGTSSAELTCTGVEADVGLNLTSHDFGDVRVGQVGEVDVTISNPGNRILTYDVDVTGAGAASFSLSGCQSGCSVAIGGSVTETITFAPATQGDKLAVLELSTNDPDEPTATVDLTGRGTDRRIVKTAPAGALALGDVVVGDESGAGTITVQNPGNLALDITSVTVSDPAFTITAGNVGASTIAAGGSRSWSVTCAPPARGALAQTFTINSNASNDPSFDVSLTCTGIGGELRATPAAVDFGDVNLGEFDVVPVELENVGELALTISDLALADTNLGYTFETPADLQLGAGETVTFDLTFAPLTQDDGGPTTLTIATDWNALTIDLEGNARTIGLDLSTTELDFGPVRWDQEATDTFSITNTGEVDAADVALALTSSSFAIVSVTVNGGGRPPGGFALAAGQTAVVTVRATPSDLMLGEQLATLEVTSDLSGAGGAVTGGEVALRVVGTAPEVALAPGLDVEFGGVDIDAGPQTIPLAVTNEGDADLDILSITLDDPTGRFDINTGGAPLTLTPLAMLQRTITYDPDIERSAGAPDEATVELEVDGPFMAPTTIVVTLTGHGTDRHLALPDDVIEFPATYRNPGDAAPVEDVVVTNTGGAPLTLSAVMLDGGGVFELVDGGPQVVAPTASATFQVRFAPTAVGEGFSGELLISHDDDEQDDGGVAIVALRGDGISRQVAVTPAELDLGVVAVGLPVRLRERIAEGLQLSSSADVAFTIAPLVLDDASGSFRLLDGAQPRTLEPGASTSYDLEFAPRAAGPHEAHVRVFLDDDPEAHVDLRVTAFAVNTQARGGCAASGGAGGWGLLAVIAVVALGRRRRRPAPLATVVSSAVALAAGAGAARADEGRDIDATTFRPRVAVDSPLFELASADVAPVRSWSLGATLGYAARPLQLDIDCGDAACPAMLGGAVDRPVASQGMLLLGGAYAVTDWLEVGGSVPLWLQAGDAPMFSTEAASGAALGDVSGHARATVWKRAALAMGASLRLAAPTASASDFIGGAGPSGELAALASWHPATSRLLVAGSIGALVRPSQAIGQTRQGSQLTYGAGAAYHATDVLWVSGELFGGVGLDEGGAANAPLQLVTGLRYQLSAPVSVGVGGGFGILSGIGVPLARGFVQLSYSPTGPGRTLIGGRVVRRDELADSDGDGIVNRDDACPDRAEDVDLYLDGDGCPDLDNDDDGVEDGVDVCPMAAEDRDGFVDEDGCPELDNDGDAVVDTRDKCPTDAEDKDGRDDLDGCPDLDDDKDGIPDADDACPLAPETINGNADDDGCADAGDGLVVRAGDQLEVLEALRWSKEATLASSSLGLLGQVAATLRASSDIAVLAIEVHVAARDAGDQARSEARAAAIVTWLTEWGIAAERLRAVGKGSSEPLVPKGDKRASKVNERVMFRIAATR